MYTGKQASASSYKLGVLQVRGEVHHDRRLHVLMLREEEMQWEQGHSKPRYHMRWNPSLGESAASPTDSAGSMHAEYMNLPDADSDQLSHYRCALALLSSAPLALSSKTCFYILTRLYNLTPKSSCWLLLQSYVAAFAVICLSHMLVI